MYKILKKSVVLITIAAMLIIPLSSEVLARTEMKQSQPDAGAMVADFVLLRPLGFVALVTGFTCFVLSSPFSALEEIFIPHGIKWRLVRHNSHLQDLLGYFRNSCLNHYCLSSTGT